MLVEPVAVPTEDACLLDGLYWPPEGAAPPGADAFVLVHGSGGNVFSPVQRGLAEGLAQTGVAVLVLNSRGHDVVSRVTQIAGLDGGIAARPAQTGGFAVEELDEAPLDFRAGLRWLTGRGHQPVGLAGHSLGAVKAILAQTIGGGMATAGVIAVSPPRFAYGPMIASFGERFRRTMERARALIEAGSPEDLLQLMRVEVPIPGYFAPVQYLKRYGPEDRYDVVRYLPTLQCPVLLLHGTGEAGELPAVSNTVAATPELVVRCPDLTVVRVEGADHFYTNRIGQMVDAVRGWLSARPATTGSGYS